MTLDHHVMVVTEDAADEGAVEDEEDIWDRNIERGLVEILMVMSSVHNACVTRI